MAQNVRGATPSSTGNCTPPAPVAARHLIGHFLPGLVLGALGPASEGRALAESADSLWLTVWGGQDRDPESFNLTLFQSGGMGARDGKDGLSATGFPSAVACVPTEIFESLTPLVHGERSLIADSGGAGRWRGGLAQRSVMRCRTDSDWTVSALADRTKFPADGLDGGGSGAAGALTVGGRAAQAQAAHADRARRRGRARPPGRRRGRRPAHTAGRGGGRRRRGRLRDARGARERYGVAIRYVGADDAILRGPEAFEVDEEETARLRTNHKEDS